MESLFEALSMMSVPCILMADINVRLDRPDDPSCVQFNDLLSVFGFQQHVDQPTHNRGGTLDVIITRDELQPSHGSRRRRFRPPFRVLEDVHSGACSTDIHHSQGSFVEVV